jgi:hypothetical protein
LTGGAVPEVKFANVTPSIKEGKSGAHPSERIADFYWGMQRK